MNEVINMQNVIKEEKKNYELRNLQAKDVFLVSKILSNIGIGEFKNSFDMETLSVLQDGLEGKNASAIGIEVFLDIANIILRNLPKCEKDLYEFLASMTGKDVQEIENLEMAIFMQLIIDVMKLEGFKDFFKVVSSLF